MSPRVLIVGNFLSASRPNRGVCEELAARLATEGWRVLSTSTRPARLARLADMVGTAWRRRRDYDVAQVDVFSGRAFVLAEAVCMTLRAANKPFVLTLHGGDLPRFARRAPGRVRRLLASASAVTTPSAYLREELRPMRGDLALLPNAIDVSRYHYRARVPLAGRLVWLRAFHRIYNPVLAPTVAARLRDAAPAVCLRQAGADRHDGSFEATRAAIAEVGLGDRVLLRDGIPKSEVPAWLDGGDIFLNTADVDNTPVSVIEAMASGLCVVSTNVGGIPYLLRDGYDALLVPPRDPDAMAAAVRRLLDDPDLARRLAQQARRTAEAFDWSAVLPRWRALLESLAARAAA